MREVNVMDAPQVQLIQSIAGTIQRPPITCPQPHTASYCITSGYEKLRSLVCEYIDYLIDQNEHITQISQAYTMPTPLDFENEQYFEELRNTEHLFPSERFRLWLKKKRKECQTPNYYGFTRSPGNTLTSKNSPTEPEQRR